MTCKFRGRHEMDLYWSSELETCTIRKLRFSAFEWRQNCLHSMNIKTFCVSLKWAKICDISKKKKKNAFIHRHYGCLTYRNLLVCLRESSKKSNFGSVLGGGKSREDAIAELMNKTSCCHHSKSQSSHEPVNPSSEPVEDVIATVRVRTPILNIVDRYMNSIPSPGIRHRL